MEKSCTDLLKKHTVDFSVLPVHQYILVNIIIKPFLFSDFTIIFKL